jgi:hypothetical protein
MAVFPETVNSLKTETLKVWKISGKLIRNAQTVWGEKNWLSISAYKPEKCQISLMHMRTELQWLSEGKEPDAGILGFQ